jgi:hypothetical protein
LSLLSAGVEPLVLAGEAETPATLTAMDKYDRSVGIGLPITVDTTGPVDVASVAAGVQPSDRPPDQHPLDFRRPLEDREDRGLQGSFRRSAAC